MPALSIKELTDWDWDWVKNSAGQVTTWSLALVLVCLLGDRLCSALSQAALLWRAVADSATHGAVGAASWAVVVAPGLALDAWMQCALCGVLASAIDVDHFLQARSLQLTDAVSLQHRPPFHSTSVVLAVTGLLWVLSLVLHQPQLKRLTLMCFVAWLSHHLRDAVRRGLWLPPFGSTPPLPYAGYVAATVALSMAAHLAYSVCRFVPSVAGAGEGAETGPLSAVLVR